MTPDQQVLNANQEALANAIKSVAFANALTWHAVAQMLEAKGVCSREQFADVAAKISSVLATSGEGSALGSQMLIMVHDQLKGINPPASAPAWTPSVVPGGRDTTAEETSE